MDRVLAEALPEISRTRLKALIEDGQVEAPGRADPAMRVREGEIFVVTVPAATSPAAAPRPQVMPLAIAHEDEHLIVIDKPAGLVVHAGAGNPDGTLVNALIAHCPEGLSSIGAPPGRGSYIASTKTPAVCSLSPRPMPRTPRSRVSSPSTRRTSLPGFSLGKSILGRAAQPRSDEVAKIAHAWL